MELLERLKSLLRGDRVIWMIVLILFLVSLLAVYSATGALAFRYQDGDTSFYIFRHLKFWLLGIIGMVLVHQVPIPYLRSVAMPFFVVGIVFLLFTLFFGLNVNQASRWLSIPLIGLSFQTSDVAKLALVVLVARKLAESQESEPERQAALNFAIGAAVLASGLVFPANLSTAVLMFATVMVLLFVGRASMAYMAGVAGIVVTLALLFVLGAKLMPGESRVETWFNRVETFVSDQGDNYQAEHAKIAVASGGIFGKGAGKSAQRNYLPHPYSDFIYAIVIEEYGLLGGIFVMLVYLTLLWRAIRLAKLCEDHFSALLVVGLAVSLVLQAMVNMAVSVNLIPVTGQPLPMVSMGGTSILFTSAALGVILSVSREQELREAQAEAAVVKPQQTVLK